MSILVSRNTSSAETQEQQLLTPDENNIWTAGAAAPSLPKLRAVEERTATTSRVRSMHQGSHHGQSVQAYMEFAPIPLGLSSSAADLPSTNMEAIKELSQYAKNLTEPMLCERVNLNTSPPGTEVYESVKAYAPNATVENIVSNMKTHGVCIKCTVSDPVLAFQPFTVKLTADDLQNCILHTQPVIAAGVESKFVKTVSQVAPHSVLFHIIKNPSTNQHHFYGINFTQRDSF